MDEKTEQTEPKPLTAEEFFAASLPGCSLTDAHRATGISYTTINDISKGRVETPRKRTLRALQEWSKKAGAPHSVFISAALVLSVDDDEEPSTTPVQS